MRLVNQPSGSRVCGQCCVAMLAGISLEEAVKDVGHERGTSIRELSLVLARHGVTMDSVLTRTVTTHALPELAILRYRYGRPAQPNSHWVVLSGCKIFDPTIAETYFLGGEYSLMIHDDECRITSFAEVHQS